MLVTLLVAGMYFYARSRATNVLKSIPNKIGYDIKQTAHGFQFSKSDGKRTLFTVEASDVKEFKLNSNAELHNVNIVLYGRDSSRYDQISGDDFAYNQKTGDVTAMGDVQIDLVANPAGLTSPDQSMPKELKNPIHLKTRDLVFNKNTGNASTNARVEFRTPQASGWAVGIKYEGKSNELILSSQIHLELSGAEAAVIEAKHGTLTNDPRQIVLDQPHLDRESGSMQADEAVFYLGPENHVQRVVATGDVRSESRAVHSEQSRKTAAQADSASQNTDPQLMRSRANQAEFLFVPGEDLLRTANLSGTVHFEQIGLHSLQGDAGRVILDFAGQNELKKVHAIEGVHLIQKQSDAILPPQKTATDSQQDFDLTAPAIDFDVIRGHVLQKAVTSGAAQITINQQSAPNSSAQRTVVTAGKFVADFAQSDGRNRLANVHGAPDARIVNSAPGQPERVSSSDSVDAIFLPTGGIDSVTQTGHVFYVDSQGSEKRMQAWADAARYTPANQILTLTGNPRIANGGMATTANTIRINRTNSDALADGDVKSTYSDVKEDPNGALLASSSPIHVTSQSMTARNAPAVALYKGNARLWQDANVIEAPSIQFDRDRRFVTAAGTPTQPVETILVQPNKGQGNENQPNKLQPNDIQPNMLQPSNKVTQTTRKNTKGTGKPMGLSPITITSAKVTYADSERRVHYEGGVLAKAMEFTASAKTADAYLLPRSQTAGDSSVANPGQLDRMVAEGGVVIQQPNRRAEGQKLVYTAAEDKFVLTGGPPCIFDAEQGKITGVSLTFFRHDDRVLVEGEASSPVVTQTRIAR